MAIVTGTLTDFGLSPMVGLSPVIEFYPSSGGVDGAHIFSDKKVTATPDSAGLWSATLYPVVNVLPAVWYSVFVKWLDSAGNFVGQTQIPGRLFVSEAGGPFSSQFATSGAIGLTWFSLSPPPAVGEFTSWLVADPDDPYATPTTPGVELGDYLEWS